MSKISLDQAPRASEIIRRFMHQWLGVHKSFVLPNYTPSSWWECDVFEITDAGYFREYEVKLTRADFFRDAKKTAERWPKKWDDPKIVERKHELLANGDPRGPKQFYYVTACGMIHDPEIPPYAGLIELSVGFRFYVVKKAPILHREKADPKIRGRALETCYYRMHYALGATAKELAP